MSVSQILQIAKSKQAYFSGKEAELDRKRFDHSVPVEDFKKQEEALDDELSADVDLDGLAKAAVMETSLAEVVDFAASLGFEADFRPQLLDGHELIKTAKYNRIDSGIFFRRQSVLKGPARSKVLDYAIEEALLAATHICVASESGKAAFYKWMSPVTHAITAPDNRWDEPRFLRDDIKERAYEHFSLDEKVRAELDKHIADKKTMLGVARGCIDKTMSFIEGFSLLFDLKSDGKIMNWRWHTEKETGVTLYGPYGRAEQFGLILPVVYNNTTRPFDHKEEFIKGESSVLNEQLKEKILPLDAILKNARELKEGYRFGMPVEAIVIERFNDGQIY